MKKENTELRNKYGAFAGTFGIISNLILGLIKLIIGFISNSVSIIADAFNSLSDSFTSILTIIGFKLSCKKASKVHPYGYARYEYVSGFVISLFMLLMGILFAKESIIKIINKEEINLSIYVYIVLIIAIIGKIIQMMVYDKISRLINSSTLKTNAIDARNDIISTVAILISMIFIKLTGINIDGYLGLAVSLFVIFSSLRASKEVLDPLIGIVPSKEQIDDITNMILSYPCVLGIHDLVIHNYGVNSDFVTVHVEIDSKMDMVVAHDYMDIIERDFKNKFSSSLTIHMDPIAVNDKETDRLKSLVTESLNKLDDSLSIHDFRIVKGKKHTNIIFDLVVPYEKNINLDLLYNYLRKEIKDTKKEYYFVIEMDRPYY